MFWRRRRRPIVTLEPDAIEEMLRGFEDEYFANTGERITSAEFYDRYKSGETGDAGELESSDAIRWASYYELLRAQGQESLSVREARRIKRPFATA
jgi:hypothetical protein